MSWFVVGGIAIGATAGAIAGSKEGGDDVWKGALIGGAIGGAGGWAAAPAAAGAAPAAGAALAPEAVGAVGVAGGAAPAAGIMGAEAAAIPGIGAASSAPIAGTSATMLPGAATPIAAAVPEAAAGSTGIASIGANAAPIAGTSSAAMPGAVSSAFAPGAQAPVTMIEAPAVGGGFGSPFTGTPGPFAGSNASFGTAGNANIVEGGGLLNEPAKAMGINNVAPAAQESIALKPGQSVTDALIEARDAGNTAVTGGAPTQSPLEKGFGSAMSWLSEPKNAMLTGVLGLGALSMFNQDNEDNFGGSTVTPAGYPLSPNFKPSRYQPTRTYAIGGPVQSGMYPQSQIPDRTQFATPTQMPASMEVLRSDYDTVTNPYTGEPSRFAKGGDTKSNAMIDPRMKTPQEKAPGWVGRSIADVNDPGIYIDRDEDTMYQDALTAAKTRMGKVAKGANVQLGAMQKPTPMGKLNLGPVAGVEEERKATGGITSLGGYAHGGNPRLLRGPGDGMSDDIPATIADKQPARLADGEFVVPADVVSGLGNGSTEAGAKKLHQMMDKVRVDRTGTKKQGKEIDADKYIPGAKAKKKAAGGIASYAFGGNVSGGNVDYSQYYVYDAAGNQVPMSTLLNATQTQTAPVSPKANTTAQGYNPDYYNPQYYQNQLTGAQSQLQSAQDAYKQASQGIADYRANYANIDRELAASQPQLNEWYLKYLGRDVDPNARLNIGNEAAIANSAEAKAWANNPLNQQYLAAQADINSANQAISQAQPNIDRLANSTIKYEPYTIANRPSSAEPQFYGNIYQPEYVDYARPGYDMNAQLGVWNNEYGGNAAPTQRQQNIANIANEQRLAQAEQLSNSQRAAQSSRQLINASVAEGKNQPAQEKKARKGGILAAKRK